MTRTPFKNFAAAALVAASLGGFSTAQAKSYVGAWDPAFGTPFDVAGSALGWSGRTEFSIADSCALSGNVLYLQCGMTIDSATVNFYNTLNPSTIVETLTFAPPATIPLSMYVPVAGGDPTGINTNGTLGSVLSTTAGLAALTLSTNYFFDLQFVYNATTGNQEVRLFYTIDNSLDPRGCAALGQSAFCGVSGPGPNGGAVVMAISPIPEPSTYALMLAGLAAIGFVARRRRST